MELEGYVVLWNWDTMVRVEQRIASQVKKENIR